MILSREKAEVIDLSAWQSDRMYPMSKDEVNYERLIKILSLYRLTLGQARQEELLEYLFREFKDTSGLKELFIDLSPFSKGKEG